MRCEHTIAAGQPRAIASIIIGKMRKGVAIVLCSAVTWQAAYAVQSEHSTSPSRQFVIYGAAAKVRGAISGLGEQTKGELLGLWRARGGGRTPSGVRVSAHEVNGPGSR